MFNCDVQVFFQKTYFKIAIFYIKKKNAYFQIASLLALALVFS